MSTARQNFAFQKIVAAISVLLFVIKIGAWYITNSVSILTDALESTINVMSGFIGLYSLYLSAQPKDENHPYGHGKVEFVSAAMEGTLIFVAGLIIIYEAIQNLKHPHEIGQLDFGIYLVSATAAVNFAVGYFAIRKGKANNSLALIASGKHLQSDTYSTLGIIVGLILIYFTRLAWLDSAVALLFSFLIMFTGYKIIRTSLAGIMDEADTELLNKVVDSCQKNRKENWIDLHNLRIIKYGGTLHLDCHMTVPWYLNVHQAHDEIDHLEKMVRENFGESVELFVHTDGCLDFSCKLCVKQDCQVRKNAFVRRLDWTVENISSNSKHKID
ncbi:MAG TPA: cation diffusion facilitator family transporter [Bacteroidia bacterium]|nr:cation diffusion facilitator family transporter [Bacteroidia bacterium]HNP97480.1 cation diffusion facilitator family transporter [Bacteroidia bacterium]